MLENLLDLRGFSFDRLRSFVRVADAGGIARATSALRPKERLSKQSQMSRQIGELEVCFGKKLIERRGRVRVLTEAGEELAALARETFKGLADFKSEVTGPSRIELGAGDSLLRWWVLPRVHAALAHVPNVTLSLTSLSSADILTRLEDARLDVGIVRQSERPTRTVLRNEALGSVEYAVFVSRTLMARARARSVEQVLAKVPLALQTSEPHFNASLVPLAKADGALGCETFPQACCAVRSGEYAALLPVLAYEELPEKVFARLELPGANRLSTRMVIVWHPRATALVKALASVLRLPGE